MGAMKKCLTSCFPKWDFRPFYLTATFWISVVQVVVFIISFTVAPQPGFTTLAANPMLGMATCNLYGMGAKWGPGVKFQFQLQRLIMPMLLHAGLFHIVPNLLFQAQLGFWLEDNMGTGKFLGLYVLSGLAGTLFGCACAPLTLSVGASGALFGLLGAHCARLFNLWSPMRDPKCHCPNPHIRFLAINLAACLGVNVLIAILAPGIIDVWAHLGGLVAGFLLGFAFLGQSKEDGAATGYEAVAGSDYSGGAATRRAARSQQDYWGPNWFGHNYRKVSVVFVVLYILALVLGLVLMKMNNVLRPPGCRN